MREAGRGASGRSVIWSKLSGPSHSRLPSSYLPWYRPLCLNACTPPPFPRVVWASGWGVPASILWFRERKREGGKREEKRPSVRSEAVSARLIRHSSSAGNRCEQTVANYRKPRLIWEAELHEFPWQPSRVSLGAEHLPLIGAREQLGPAANHSPLPAFNNSSEAAGC